MKAFVVPRRGEAPQVVTDFPEPVAQGDAEMMVNVKAAAVKNLDRMRASGAHYSVGNTEGKPQVVGTDAVGTLADGRRVYVFGSAGAIAEKIVADKRRFALVPDGIDDATAAALPNAVMGSALALRFRARMQGGETVLVNGATGVTGKIAVQLAKHYGARKIIATGRNPQALEQLRKLGADEVISLSQDEATLTAQIKAIHQETPFDIVLDYLWGRPAELILNLLKGSGGHTPRTRFVNIGAMAGDTLPLSSGILRSTDLHLSGSGLGSWSREETNLLFTEILPQMFRLAASGKLTIATHTAHIEDAACAWNDEGERGSRLVVLVG